MYLRIALDIKKENPHVLILTAAKYKEIQLNNLQHINIKYKYDFKDA